MTTFIHERLRIGFIDVPMAGGQYVTSCFFPSREHPSFAQASPHNERFAIHDRIGRIGQMLGEELDSYFLFAFVRNTYDWLLARYQFTRNAKMHPDHERCSGLSFEDYILQEGDSGAIRLQKPHVYSEDYMVGCIRSCEDFASELQSILDELEFRPQVEIGERADLRLDYRPHYNESMRRHVEDVYAEDIDYFGFRF